MGTIGVTSIEDVGGASVGGMVSVAGIVSGLLVRWSKSGNRYAQFRLEDRTGNAKVLVWSETFTRISKMLADDALLIIDGKLENNDGGEITIVASEADLCRMSFLGRPGIWRTLRGRRSMKKL